MKSLNKLLAGITGVGFGFLVNEYFIRSPMNRQYDNRSVIFQDLKKKVVKVEEK